MENPVSVMSMFLLSIKTLSIILFEKNELKNTQTAEIFCGAEYLMVQQGNTNPYIRKTEQFPDGHFLVHLQSKEQSRLLMHSFELHVDKTFKRTKCKEFEFNSYDPIMKRIATLARVFTDFESAEGYFHAFKLVFDQAEKDMGYNIPFGHIVKSDQDSPTGSRIKAILVDEHGGQIKGLGQYFESKYPHDTGADHILQIVKTCQVHWERSIKSLEKAGVDKGI
jgi:hypothetical protein